MLPLVPLTVRIKMPGKLLHQKHAMQQGLRGWRRIVLQLLVIMVDRLVVELLKPVLLPIMLRHLLIELAQMLPADAGRLAAIVDARQAPDASGTSMSAE